MDGPKRLTIQYFFRHMFVYAGFPVLAVALTGLLCVWGFPYLPIILGYDMDAISKVANVACFLPMVAAYIGYYVGLRVSSRIFKREQMYEVLVGLKPNPRSIKSANRLLDRLYKTATL